MKKLIALIEHMNLLQLQKVFTRKKPQQQRAKGIRCVQSSFTPSEQLDFNDIALHIATNTNRTPLERMEGLLTEKTYRR
jgi:hypothetical protein